MKKGKAITDFQLYQVNAFVARNCRGNPAGVCLLPETRDEKFYQKIAIKMDLAETAFIVRNGNIFNLRWFTRGGMEVALCGHATLASAYILRQKGYISSRGMISFQTKSGILTAKADGEHITLDFPLDEITGLKEKKNELGALLGLTPLYTAKTKFDYLVVVDSDEVIINLKPDFEKLKKLQGRGIIVTASASGKKYDFVSRFFAPALGVDEDPVTGSAHCALGQYWGSVIKKSKLVGYQASKEGGIVHVEVLKDRVLLSGQAREIPLSNDKKKTIQSF